MTTITLPRAVVEQALGALESVYGDSCDALHALRAALAQQQAKPQGCDHCRHPLYAATRCRVCGRVTEQAEPVQEPPQRKPLTQEQLYALYDEHATHQEEGPAMSGWFDFARAIERAHGIGGQE